MLSRHSFLAASASSGIGGSASRPAGRDRRSTRAAFQRGVRSTGLGKAQLEERVRLQERRRERARIAQELHDTLFQGFVGASMLLHDAVEQTPADSPSKPALSRALRLIRQAIDEGRAALRGPGATSPAPSSLEQALANLLNEVAPGAPVQPRFLVQGKPLTLAPAIQEQLFLIGREAVMNALRHSHATEIDVEVQYLGNLLRLVVRDNGSGIDPEAVNKESGSHWGLAGMRERAENIGARFGIWSRTGAGTEVLVATPVDVRTTHR